MLLQVQINMIIQKNGYDYLIMYLIFNILLIQLPNNNFQSINMQTQEYNVDSMDQNQGYSSIFKLSFQKFKIQEQNLMINLENALQVNKQLILNSLFLSYFSNISSPVNNPSTETNETGKNMEEIKFEKLNDGKKQYSKLKYRIKKKRQSYDTKNIPKNFGTAIHIFIKRNSAKVKNLLGRKKVSYSQFYQFNKEAKQKINSLLHLRELWEHNQFDAETKLKECYRIISFEFMRKHCLGYIFGSRIKNTSSHIRYRKKLLQGIERPHTLFNLKDY